MLELVQKKGRSLPFPFDYNGIDQACSLLEESDGWSAAEQALVQQIIALVKQIDVARVNRRSSVDLPEVGPRFSRTSPDALLLQDLPAPVWIASILTDMRTILATVSPLVRLIIRVRSCSRSHALALLVRLSTTTRVSCRRAV